MRGYIYLVAGVFFCFFIRVLKTRISMDTSVDTIFEKMAYSSI